MLQGSAVFCIGDCMMALLQLLVQSPKSALVKKARELGMYSEAKTIRERSSELFTEVFPKFQIRNIMTVTIHVPEKVIVHPLVLLSVTDHYNRSAKNTKKRVVGVLLGQQNGNIVNVANSYAGI